MITTRVADSIDNAELCDLLNNTVLPGQIGLSYTRNPDFFAACKIEGKTNQVMISHDNDGIGNIAIRSIKNLFVNGKQQEFGYLHTLRANPNYNNDSFFLRNFMFFRKLHNSDKRVKAYLATTIKNNSGEPTVFDRLSKSFGRIITLGTFITYAIPLKIKSRNHCNITTVSDIEIVKGSKDQLPQILNFLNECGKNRQFYPAYTLEDFDNFIQSGFNPEHFYLTKRNGVITSSLAIWDQSSVKQITLHYYKGYLKVLYWPLRFLMKSLGFHTLTSPGAIVNTSYACFIGSKDSFTQDLSFILNQAISDLHGSNQAFLSIGFHEKDPLNAIVKKHFMAVKYLSTIHCFAWRDDPEFMDTIKNSSMIPYLELCTL